MWNNWRRGNEADRLERAEQAQTETAGERALLDRELEASQADIRAAGRYGESVDSFTRFGE